MCKRRGGLGSTHHHTEIESLDQEYDSNSNAECLFSECNSVMEKRVEVQLDGKKVSMQIDTGAGMSIISSRIWKRIRKPTLKKRRNGPVGMMAMN